MLCSVCGSNQARVKTVVNFNRYGHDYIFECDCGIKKSGFIRMHDLIHNSLDNIILKEVWNDYR